MLPLANASRVQLLDIPELLRELRGLERRRGTAGKDRVDHTRGAHDDLAAAVAGVVALLGSGAPDAPAVSLYNEGFGRYMSSDERAHLPCEPGSRIKTQEHPGLDWR
jgi:hypothetical protein